MEAEHAGLTEQSFDPNAELEDWGPFQPLGEETRSPSGMYDEEDGAWVRLHPCACRHCVCVWWCASRVPASLLTPTSAIHTQNQQRRERAVQRHRGGA